MSQEEQQMVLAVRKYETVGEALLGGINPEPHGLAIEMSQDCNFKHVQVYPDKRFVEGIGTWAPVVCNTQAEKDYLEALALMLGKDTKDWIVVDGMVDSLPLGVPPTHARIPSL